MSKIKYPLTSLSPNLWEIPGWCIQENSPVLLEDVKDILQKIDDWHVNMIRNVVKVHDFLEKERKESAGTITVKGCYVNQQKLLEFLLGTSVEQARTFLADVTEGNL